MNRLSGQITAREGELRFGLRSEFWAYRFGECRTDWSGWAEYEERTYIRLRQLVKGVKKAIANSATA